MSAHALRTALEAAGIRLRRDGGDLLVSSGHGASLDPFRQRIREFKPQLLAVLELQEQIVAAASVAPSQFDRRHYDALWRRWHALNAPKESDA